jgi:hypothetical protein
MSSKDVFISHIHEDDDDLASMKTLLEDNGYTIRDSSINSTNPNEASDPDYIKNEILAPRIRWASTMVVLISTGTKDHDWVTWEIEYAAKLGKRIVGVWEHGAAEADVPLALELYADAVVGWQADRINGAINGTVNNWETSQGQVRDPRLIAHYSCQ